METNADGSTAAVYDGWSEIVVGHDNLGVIRIDHFQVIVTRDGRRSIRISISCDKNEFRIKDIVQEDQDLGNLVVMHLTEDE